MDASLNETYSDDTCPVSGRPAREGGGAVDWGTAAAAGEGLSATATVFFVLLPELCSAIGASPQLLALCWTAGTLAGVFLATVLLAVFFRLAVFGLPQLLGALSRSLLPDFAALQPQGAGGTRAID